MEQSKIECIYLLKQNKRDMKIKDKVKSRLSLWSGDIGKISGITPIWSLEEPNKKIGDFVHVIFPETEKHYAYQQSFNSKDLIIVESVG